MKHCNEVLWSEVPGVPIAVCTRQWGTEHSHTDCSAEEYIARGEARSLSDGDVLKALEFPDTSAVAWETRDRMVEVMLLHGEELSPEEVEWALKSALREYRKER